MGEASEESDSASVCLAVLIVDTSSYTGSCGGVCLCAVVVSIGNIGGDFVIISDLNNISDV